MLIYDRPDRLIDALRLGGCSLIAHDQSLVMARVTGPLAPKELSERFDEKLSFNDVFWGLGVRKEAQGDLGVVLSLVMADLHRSGALQNLARQHQLDVGFLDEQRLKWADTQCLQEQRVSDACLKAPSNLADLPTSFAPTIRIFENSLSRYTDRPLKFPMLTGQSAAQLFVTGLIVSLILVAGSVTATLAFAFLFYTLLRSRFLLTRILGNIITQFFQSSPIILLLVLGYLLVTFITPYGPILAVFVSIVVIGLSNGANGGSAMNETALSFECAPPALTIAKDASIQLRAAIINAAKASPVAAFIGAPDLLAVLTDITSFTGERITTFIFLSIFYLCLTQMVVIVSGRLIKRLKKDA
jgi:ABC-type amino acid transport system permease subunit